MLIQHIESLMIEKDRAEKTFQYSYDVTLSDLRMLRSTNKEQKQLVESSAFYVGFRLQWILRIFLKGQKFPHGKLDDKQYMINVLQIVDFMTVEDNLVIMLDFDSASFFLTVARLFVGMPWWFITKKGEYKFHFEKEEVAGAEAEFEQKT